MLNVMNIKLYVYLIIDKIGMCVLYIFNKMLFLNYSLIFWSNRFYLNFIYIFLNFMYFTL